MKKWRKLITWILVIVLMAGTAGSMVSTVFAGESNAAEATASACSSLATNDMPSFSDAKITSSGIKVSVRAEAGTFPEGTTVKVSSIPAQQAIKAAQNLFKEDVVDGAAVDITFFDKNGKEIEPADQEKVHVKLELTNNKTIDGETYDVVHIKNGNSAEKLNGGDVGSVTDKKAEFLARSFSVYAIIGLKDKDINVNTYEFYDGTNKVSEQKVKKGDTLLEPKIPETKENKTFSGWFDEKGNQFTKFGPVTDLEENDKTIKLYARYSSAVYIFYYDQYNNLIKSQKVEPNSTVTIDRDAPLVQVEPLTQCQEGWSRTINGKDDVSGKLKVGTESVKLYPILKNGYWVTFDTNGGSSIARQFIEYDATGDNKKAKKPSFIPAKKGYVFDKWYQDVNLTNEYDFNQDITDPTTIYAGYKPKTDTEYTVRYLTEYQVSDGPEGTVGEGIWDYKFLAREVKKGTTGEKAEYDSEYIFKSPYGKSHNSYEIDNDKTKDTIIKSDGSSVYNVYYKCKTYGLSISVPKEGGGNEVIKYDAVKYSASLSNLWKKVFLITPENVLFDGQHRFYYSDGSGSTFVERPSELNNMPAEAVNVFYQGMGTNNSYAVDYLETLRGKSPSGQPVTKNESLRKDGDDREYYMADSGSFTSGTYGAISAYTTTYTGFSPYPEHSDGHYWVNSSGTHVIFWFRYPEELFYRNNPNDPKGAYHVAKNSDGSQHMYSGKDDPIRVYFTRNSYDLSFHTNGGPSVSRESVLYEDDLGQCSPSEYSVGVTRKVEGNQEFVFDGWYSDSGLTTPFSFEGTMPAYNINLYAKWKPKTYTVTFDTGNGSKIASLKDIPYGTSIAKPEDPTYEGRIFLGWTLEGRPFNFENGITNDITLKAEWRSIKAYQVTYDLNGGTGTVPKDDKNYYENAGVTVASVEGITAPKGKVFTGWKSTGDGKIYYPYAVAPMAFGGMKLAAQWGNAEQATKLTYDFNFDKYGIEADDPSSSTVYGISSNSKIKLAEITSLREAVKGYAFKGWYLDKDCKDGPYDRVLVDSLSDNHNKVYAKWNKIFSVTYQDGNDGKTFSEEKHLVENGQKTPEFEGGTPSRSGYTFEGWSPAISDVVNKDVIYVAQWKKVEEEQYNDVEHYGSVTLHKESEKGLALKGAVFELRNDAGEKFGTYTTDANGLISISSLPYGSYYFTEAKAPDGYVLDGKELHFTLDGTKDSVTLKVVNKKKTDEMKPEKTDSTDTKPAKPSVSPSVAPSPRPGKTTSDVANSTESKKNSTAPRSENRNKPAAGTSTSQKQLAKTASTTASTAKAVKTGDTRWFVIWGLILAGAAIVLAVTVSRRD